MYHLQTSLTYRHDACANLSCHTAASCFRLQGIMRQRWAAVPPPAAAPSGGWGLPSMTWAGLEGTKPARCFCCAIKQTQACDRVAWTKGGAA